MLSANDIIKQENSESEGYNLKENNKNYLL